MTNEKRKEILEVTYEEGTFKQNVLTAIRAKVPILAVHTEEEIRFLEYMKCLTQEQNMNLYTWNVIDGLVNFHTKEKIEIISPIIECIRDEYERLIYYIDGVYDINFFEEKKKEEEEEKKKADVYLLFDFAAAFNSRIKRRIKNLANKSSSASIIFVSRDAKYGFDSEMRTLIPVFESPAPKIKELKMILYEIADQASHRLSGIISIIQYTRENEEEILEMLQGKTIVETRTLLTMNLTKYNRFLKYH